MTKYSEYKNKLDGFYFILDEKSKLKIETFKYNDPGEVISNDLGDFHHIIIFKEDENQEIKDPTNFEAILLDPVVYARQLIQCGYYGMISKKTTTSKEWVDTVWDLLLQDLN